ncbi:isochorismatase [Opitutaceae bacterium EW11]|nr:isochorismatase [Opitutaceae bacterium EW11]
MADTFAPFTGAMLLCLDVQPAFLKAIADRNQLVRRCSFGVSAAQGLGLRVAFTEQMPQKLGGTAPELLACAKSPVLYSKSTFSAFGDDGIREAIRSADIEHIILCGLETPICVYQTALDAVDNNLQVTILSDAVGCRRPADGEVCLRSLTRHGIYVLPSETVFYSLLQSAQHPFFKAYTELVKSYA